MHILDQPCPIQQPLQYTPWARRVTKWRVRLSIHGEDVKAIPSPQELEKLRYDAESLALLEVASLHSSIDVWPDNRDGHWPSVDMQKRLLDPWRMVRCKDFELSTYPQFDEQLKKDIIQKSRVKNPGTTCWKPRHRTSVLAR